MKIAHVYDEHYRVSPKKGSVAKVIYNLATTQSDLGHDVSVIERQWSDLPRKEVLNGVRFNRIPLRIGSDIEGEEIPYQQIKNATGFAKMIGDRAELAVKLRNHFQKVKYDVIHFHVPFAANILIHIYPQIRDRIVYTAHVGEEDIRFGLSKNGIVSSITSVISPDLHLMQRVAASSVLNERLEAQLPLNDLYTIPNGVDIDKYNPQNSELVDLEEKYEIQSPFVLFTGTHTPRKGPDILIDAIASLEDRNVVGDFSFVFVGNQNIEPEFVDKLHKRADNLDTSIHFLGFVDLDELQSLYASCDVFALPSHEEGWGMVITEAMASGAPIVATDVSGIPEQVRNGENGYLVEPGNPNDLSYRLESLIQHPKRREKMGRRSRDITINEFSWRSVVEKYLSMYANSIQ